MEEDFIERDLNDEVYEDDYYEENYDVEELRDSEDFLEDDDDLYSESGDRKVHISYACEDCDYRWEDVFVKKRNDYDDVEMDIICPMCGSINITLI